MVDVGYFTAITMCYFLVEGYGYTRSKEKYGKRLLLFALISEIPFCLAFTEEGTISFVSMNMLFTLFLCFLILYAMEKSLQEPGRHSASWAWYLPPPTATGPFLPLSSPIGSQAVASGMHRGKCCQPAAGMLIRKAIWLAARILNEKTFMEGFQKGNAVLWSVKPCRKHGADHSCQGCYPVPRRHRRNSALSTLHHLSLQRKALKKHRTFSKWFFYIFIRHIC